MLAIQISKIQLRRGPQSDLPGMPLSLGPPPSFSDSLDDGELGFATDTGRLFIGQNSNTDGMRNFRRTTFPYRNIEILTENTPNMGMIWGDNQGSFIEPSNLIPAVSDPSILMTTSGIPLYLDMPGSGANAIIKYFVFGSDGPLRSGTISVVWNSAMTNPPSCVDEATTDINHVNDIQWTAEHMTDHIILKYINKTGEDLTIRLSIDRPLIV